MLKTEKEFCICDDVLCMRRTLCRRYRLERPKEGRFFIVSPRSGDECKMFLSRID